MNTDYLTKLIDSYDDKQLRKMLFSMDVAGKPLFRIFDGLPDNIARSVVSMLDMIVEYTMSEEYARAHNYKKGLRCFEELYHLFHSTDFLKNFESFAKQNGFYSDEDEAVPMINEDGSLEKLYKFVNIKHITPGFGRDQDELDLKMRNFQDFIKSMIPGDFHIRAERCEPIFGPVTPGRYERGLEGFRVKFVFKA